MNVLNMSLIVRLVVLVTIVTKVADSRMIGIYTCPRPQSKQNIKTELMYGTWYEQQRYFTLFERRDRCASVNYTSTSTTSNTDDIRIKYKQVAFWGETVYLEGTAYRTNININDGKYLAHFPNDQNRHEFYWIVDTDYKNFAIVWACSEEFIVNSQELWILTRKKNPEKEEVDAYRSIASNNGASTWALINTLQNC